MNKLTKEDIQEILYINKQGNGRHNLICNLYRLSKSELQNILNNYR